MFAVFPAFPVFAVLRPLVTPPVSKSVAEALVPIIESRCLACDNNTGRPDAVRW